MTNLTTEVLTALDNAQNSYIHSLDSKNMDGWLANFTNDGSYICIAAENEANNLPIALMLDDCYARLQDRVTYVTKVWAGTFEDYQTRHFTQRIAALPRNRVRPTCWSPVIIRMRSYWATPHCSNQRKRSWIPTFHRGISFIRSRLN